ncbi:MAG: prolyl-tRNA synthetase associated domain-containing protein [Clostridia bacterium]|nr:prolyl-tRNA synthetase associated domain-containing protein [Clostridia bacterium]
MILEKGRPADMTGRNDEEIKTYDLLDRLGVSYQRIDHEPAMTMEICQEIDRSLQAVICKNLFLCNRQQTAFYLLMMPGDKPFKTKELSSQIGSSRLSFGSPEKMQEYLHITPGSVSVMGLMNDTEHKVELLIDKDVLSHEYFGCHPCINTSSLKLFTKDLTEVILPALGHIPRLVELPKYETE